MTDRFPAVAQLPGTWPGPPSFIAECDDGINPGRSARGRRTGDQSHKNQHPGDRGESKRIAGTDFEQERPEQPCEPRGGCQAERLSRGDGHHGLPQHQSKHLPATGSESKTHPDLAGSLAHGKRQHSVNSD